MNLEEPKLVAACSIKFGSKGKHLKHLELCFFSNVQYSLSVCVLPFISATFWGMGDLLLLLKGLLAADLAFSSLSLSQHHILLQFGFYQSVTSFFFYLLFWPC